MRTLLGALALVVVPAAAFLAAPPAAPGRMLPSASRQGPRFALRQTGACALRAQSVESLIEKASKASPNVKVPTAMYKGLKKSSGAKTISYEFKRRVDIEVNTQFEFDELGYHLRTACKIGMLVVDSMDPAGISDEEAQEDIKKLAKEQATAKGKFPGPVPIVWRKNFQSIEQIAEAKWIGCYSVTLVAENLAPETLASLVNACHALGMEPLVEVNDKEQVEAAVQAGAKCVNVRFSSGAVASFLVYATKSLAGDLRKVSKDIAVIGTIQARQGGAEIEQAQQVLALEGFHGVLFSGAILDARDKENVGYTGYLVEVLTSKRSKNVVVNEKKGSTGIGGYGTAQGWGNEGTHV